MEIIATPAARKKKIIYDGVIYNSDGGFRRTSFHPDRNLPRHATIVVDRLWTSAILSLPQYNNPTVNPDPFVHPPDRVGVDLFDSDGPSGLWDDGVAPFLDVEEWPQDDPTNYLELLRIMRSQYPLKKWAYYRIVTDPLNTNLVLPPFSGPKYDEWLATVAAKQSLAEAVDYLCPAFYCVSNDAGGWTATEKADWTQRVDEHLAACVRFGVDAPIIPYIDPWYVGSGTPVESDYITDSNWRHVLDTVLLDDRVSGVIVWGSRLSEAEWTVNDNWWQVLQEYRGIPAG